MENEQTQLLIADHDFRRLNGLIQTSNSEIVDLLDEELARAKIVPIEKLPSDVAAMNSTVRFRDLNSDHETEVQLVYPHEADASKGRISILSPIGAALIGLRVGQWIEWPVPHGRKRSIRILAVSKTAQDKAS